MQEDLDTCFFLEAVELVISLLGLALNLFQFYLIAKHTTKTVKPYAPILYQNCVTDCIYICSIIITRIQADVKDGIVFYTVSLPYFENVYIILLAASFWVFSIALYSFGVPVQFVYRYIYVIKLTNVSTTTHMSMIAVAISISCIMCAFCWLAFWDSPQIAVKSIATLHSFYGNSIKFKMVSSYVSNVWLAIYLYSALVFLVISGLVIFISTILFLKHVRRHQSVMSSSTREANTQITKILVVQAAIPVCVCTFPLLIFFYQVFFSSDSSVIPRIIIPIVSVFPLFNSILVIYFMKSYRMFVMSKLLGICEVLIPYPKSLLNMVRSGSVIPTFKGSLFQS